ncbi:unnamed protein product [Chilo suppressalis]|uniref:RING-type E3 ubiquitin transferase BRCA1 n=1 Tax=Chilo suppressalis TaxID=168631 RepID=A0ABN8EBI0_CHISP|nr:unnamed protein product [Chilo suppressalis]
MDLKALDVSLLMKLIIQQVDNVTCLECCKYYIAPETAACGHTLCHTCWRGRRTCPCCAASLDRRLLKLNIPMQNRTEHIQTLGETFEKLFDTKLDEFTLDVSVPEIESLDDATKNVNYWLASSQNHFSAPLLNSEEINSCVQEVNNPIEISSSKIQIHTNSKKSSSPSKVVYVQQSQHDWDKIEQLSDVEGHSTNKENDRARAKPVLSLIEESEYTLGNPRRSSRKRDLNQSEPTIRREDISLEKFKDSSPGTDKKSNKGKNNWNNVKRMRKEFSKLNKQNRSKLNVSIEMCKKAQNAFNNPDIDAKEQKTTDSQCPLNEYLIEDNTPIGVKENPKEIDKNVLSESTKYNSIEKDAHANTNIGRETSSNNVANQPLVVVSSHVKLDHEYNKTYSPTKHTEKTIPESIHKDLNNMSTKLAFYKKGTLCPTQGQRTNVQTVNIDGRTNNNNSNTEDIEINIKVGNTLTNIVIKRKTNDIQLKVNTDREVQTSQETNQIVNIHNEYTELQKRPQNVQVNVQEKDGANIAIASKECKSNSVSKNILQKSLSTKRNTASADTVTAQFEITESVEKELSNIMECEEIVDNNRLTPKNKVPQTKNKLKNNEAVNNKTSTLNKTQSTHDFEIFDNGSTCEQNVDLLKDSTHAASDILVPTVNNKKMLSNPDKRDREIGEIDEMPTPKKLKTMTNENPKPDEIISPHILHQKNKTNVIENDSIIYDVVMDQVFASIDADINNSEKCHKKNDFTKLSKDTPGVIENEKKQEANFIATQKKSVIEHANEKYSENIFSFLEKDTDSPDIITKGAKDDGSTQRHIDNLLTPRIFQDLDSTHEETLLPNLDVENKDICTPKFEQDDSDKSVVEETPQKNISFSKPKSKTEISFVNLPRSDSGSKNDNGGSSMIKSVITLSDSIVDSIKTSKDATIVDVDAKRHALETPLTINRFVDHIKHKSTPVARKSLNFANENIEDDDDPEQTLCPSSVIAKTTQEKEIMSKAFEKTPNTPVKKVLTTKNIKVNNMKYCIAGSCLSTSELTNVKSLCRKYNWQYIDKYSRELTHLVVGVDDENKSQRSVKYMCALAASKWIVSYEWVENCLKMNLVVAENQYEALDGTGEPGPKRSRLAKKKLFQGITFFCMPPFSVLDINTLKEMLEASGGRVVEEAKAVKATSDAPALLLAEPEHTQEDRFVYLALELGIVPVNYEWVLNCLGSYTLSSVHELLLCPAALLPPPTAKWPTILISRDSE